MRLQFTRRHLLTKSAALAVAPTLPALAQSLDEDPCTAERTDGNWQVKGSVSEIENSEIEFGLRTEHITIYSASPAMFIKHNAGPTSHLFPDAPIDPNSINISLYKSEWEEVKAQTQPEIDAARESVAVAEKSGQGLRVYRWIAVLIADPAAEEPLRLDYRYEHAFDRWEALPDEDGNTLRERESQKLQPHTEALTLVKALKVLTSGKALRMGKFVFDDAANTWTTLEERDLDTAAVVPLYKAVRADLATLRKNQPAQECVVDGCFLTTACCDYMGRTDHCYELRTLRGFRDGWLAVQPEGRALIKEYYQIAPALCRALDGDSAALRTLYWGTILPCVAAIRLGQNRIAYRLYCRMIARLRRRYPHAA